MPVCAQADRAAAFGGEVRGFESSDRRSTLQPSGSRGLLYENDEHSYFLNKEIKI